MKRDQIQNGYFKIRENSKGEVFVTLCGANHEPLSVTESFKNKASAYANIQAQVKATGGKGAMLIDFTIEKKPVVHWMDQKGDFFETDAIVIAVPSEPAPAVNSDAHTEGFNGHN